MTVGYRPVLPFPQYEVNREGDIKSTKTKRSLQVSLTHHGHPKVNLMKHGEVYTRNVNHIVAKAFLDPPQRADFISLIHLDGNRENCHASNLAWRPRSFAIRYHSQFNEALFHTSNIRIVDRKNGDIYERAQDAVVQHGLLLKELLISIHERTYVWPTYHEFAKFEN